jgi:hypothetical protein
MLMARTATSTRAFSIILLLLCDAAWFWRSYRGLSKVLSPTKQAKPLAHLGGIQTSSGSLSQEFSDSGSQETPDEASPRARGELTQLPPSAPPKSCVDSSIGYMEFTPTITQVQRGHSCGCTRTPLRLHSGWRCATPGAIAMVHVFSSITSDE